MWLQRLRKQYERASNSAPVICKPAIVHARQHLPPNPAPLPGRAVCALLSLTGGSRLLEQLCNLGRSRSRSLIGYFAPGAVQASGDDLVNLYDRLLHLLTRRVDHGPADDDRLLTVRRGSNFDLSLDFIGTGLCGGC